MSIYESALTPFWGIREREREKRKCGGSERLYLGEGTRNYISGF
jgi:hypothetical protein